MPAKGGQCWRNFQIISLMSFTQITTILLIPLSLILYKHEGNEKSLLAFKNRFRLNLIAGKLWFLVIGVLIVCIISDLSLDGIGRWLGKIHFFRTNRVSSCSI